MSTRSNSSCPPDPFAYVVDGVAPVESCDPSDSVGSTPTSSAAGDLLPETLIASPRAAWGYDLPLPAGVTLADLVPSDSLRVRGSMQPNADYEAIVVETPWIASPGSAARSDDPVNGPLIKKILLSEFISEYIGEVRSYTFNVRGGLSIDESLTLNALFQWILEERSPSPMHVIIRARNPTDPIFIDRLVTNYASNVLIEFRSPVVYGASGGLRLMGDQPEITRNGKLKAKLRATFDADEGDTVLTLSNNIDNMLASDFEDGDVIIIRGQNDASGKALSKQVLHIVSRDEILNTITLQEELESDFLVVYPESDWSADLTTGTTISLAAFAAATADWARGDQTVAVNPTQMASSGIVVGSIVLVSTSETEYDINPHAHASGGAPYANSARLEIKKIIALTASTVTFDTPLVDDYATLWNAGVTLYAPIENSVIKGVRASYNADQLSRNTHGIQLGYAFKCRVSDCHVDGSGGIRGAGIRISNSLECEADSCVVSNPKYVGSGEGYGIAIYYADRCRVIRCVAEGCRHNILCQKSNHTDIINCVSINDGISGIDLHGVNSIRTHIHGCRLIGGPAFYDNTLHKSLLRIGNTSHAVGDFGTLITGCFLSGAKLSDAAIDYGSIQDPPVTPTYAALEIFGASAGVSMHGCRLEDCDTGLRAGYDNLSTTETDAILDAIISGNDWKNITFLSDIKSTSTVELRGGILKVGGTNSLATGASSTTATIPFDATAPLISEGAEVITTSYVARAAGSQVKVTFCAPMPNVSATDNVLVALFAGSVCIGVAVVRQTTGANSGEQIIAIGTFIGDGSAQTISARIGSRTGITLWVVAPGNSLGGFNKAFLLFEE